MNFWKWLESGLEKKVHDGSDEDIATHMKRYHPNGFDPKSDRCILVDKDNDIDGVVSNESPYSNGSPNYYEQYTKGVTFQEIEKWIRKNCGGTKLLHVKGIDDFEDNNLWFKIGPNFDAYGDYPSREIFEDTCRNVYSVCRDLKRRFNNIPLDIDWIIPFEFKEERYGSSSYDRRQGLSYLGIGSSIIKENFSELSFMHKDQRAQADVIRHEIGHNLATNDIFLFAKDRIDEYVSSLGQEEAACRIVESISMTAAFFIGGVISGEFEKGSDQYNKWIDETIAELFSRYTSPDYKDGTIDKTLTEIVEKMVRKSDMIREDKQVTDSVDFSDDVHESTHSSDYIEDKIPCSFTCGDKGPTEYGYWDTATGEWIEKKRDDKIIKIIEILKQKRKNAISELRELSKARE